MANEKRLIDANRFLRETRFQEGVYPHKTLKMELDAQPTVDAVEVVHGEWIEKREIPSYSNKNIPVVECSKCRCIFCDIINVHSYMYHYCPHCGAKMDGGYEDG